MMLIVRNCNARNNLDCPEHSQRNDLVPLIPWCDCIRLCIIGIHYCFGSIALGQGKQEGLEGLCDGRHGS